jgi:secreted Zn-dependent insulinase-like peptidase
MDAEDLLTDLVVSMTRPYHRKPRELLEARYLVKNWNPDGVREILRLLTPCNSHITLTSSLFHNEVEEGDESEASNVDSEGGDDEDDSGEYDDDDDSDEDEDEDDGDENIEFFTTEEELALLITIPESHRPLSRLPTITSPLFKSIHFKMSFWKDLINEELLTYWSDERSIVTDTDTEQASLHLPPPNQFIPTNFTILPPKKKNPFPEIVFSSPLVRVWHSTSQRFQVPKGVIKFSFLSNYLLENSSCPSDPENEEVSPLPSPTVFVMNDLLSLVMNEILVQDLYMAEMASMECRINSRINGIVVSTYGYHDKIIPLASMILNSFFHGLDHSSPSSTSSPSSSRFQKILNLQIEKLKKAYLNDSLFSSDAANAQRLEELLPHQVPKSLRLETLQIVSSSKNKFLHSFEKYLKVFLSSCRCEIMIQGNLSVQQAIAFGKEVKAQFEPKSQRASKGKRKDPRGGGSFDVPRPIFVRTIEPFTSIEISPKSSAEKNVCLQFYFQIGSSPSVPSSPRDFALLQLIERIMEEPLFNELRTQKQVGFVLFVLSVSHSTVGL